MGRAGAASGLAVGSPAWGTRFGPRSSEAGGLARRGAPYLGRTVTHKPDGLRASTQGTAKVTQTSGQSGSRGAVGWGAAGHPASDGSSR